MIHNTHYCIHSPQLCYSSESRECKNSPSYLQIPSNGSLKPLCNDKDQSTNYIHQISTLEKDVCS